MSSIRADIFSAKKLPLTAAVSIILFARLLLVKENILDCSGIFKGSSKKLDRQDIERIFKSYDRVSGAGAQQLKEQLRLIN